MSTLETRRVQQLFDLPAHDGRLVGEIDRDGTSFNDTWCDVDADQPASVFVKYTHVSEGEGPYVIEGTYSFDAAKDALGFLFMSDLVSESDPIEVTVNAWYLRYVLKDAA